MIHHLLEQVDRDYCCVRCEVRWRGLTAADVDMLKNRGQCPGEPAPWVPCLRRGMMCYTHSECRERARA